MGVLRMLNYFGSEIIIDPIYFFLVIMIIYALVYGVHLGKLPTEDRWRELWRKEWDQYYKDRGLDLIYTD